MPVCMVLCLWLWTVRYNPLSCLVGLCGNHIHAMSSGRVYIRDCGISIGVEDDGRLWVLEVGGWRLR